LSFRLNLAKPLPPRCASQKDLVQIKPSLQFFVTPATNISHRSSTATGWLPSISIQAFPWNDARTLTSEKTFESGNEESTFPEKRCFLRS